MAFGDELGLFWTTPQRVNKNTGSRELVFDVSRITAESNWTPPDEFPSLSGLVALDLETEDPDLKTIGPSWAFPNRGKIVGVAIATADRQWYFPTQHEGGGNLDHRMIMRWLGVQLAKPGIELATANGPYDLGWLARDGIDFRGPVHDVQVMMALLDEHRFSYGLDNLGKDILGVGKDESLLERAIEQAGASPRMTKSLLWRLPSRFVGPYGEQDARVTYDLCVELRKRLEAAELMPIYRLEQRMTPLAMRMRMRGVRVDTSRVDEVRAGLVAKEQAIVAEVKALVGVNIDAWDKDSIVRALRAEGIEPPKTARGQYSVVKEWLENAPGTVAKSVRAIRVYNKARTTFVDGHIARNSAIDGRIHCTFHQLKNEDDEGNSSGTITGRWSSSGPNLQQIPKRNKEIQKLIRTMLLPDEGQQWAALDFSSQENRLIIHFAALAKVAGGADAVRQFNDDPRTDYHQMVADFCSISRDEAKPINLGIGFGMGGAKLCRSLGLPTAWCIVRRSGGRTHWSEPYAHDALPDDWQADGGQLVEVAGEQGKDILKRYHAGAPWIKGMIELTMARGARKGHIRTLLGRHARFDKYAGSDDYKDIHAALNKLSQGSAADQIKQAMCDLDDEGVTPLVTVHDELGLSVSSYAEARHAANVMENAVKLLVPSIVDVKMGLNWGEVKDADKSPSMGNGTLLAA